MRRAPERMLLLTIILITTGELELWAGTRRGIIIVIISIIVIIVVVIVIIISSVIILTATQRFPFLH